MLTDPKLSLFTGMEEDINEADERPQHKITSFRCGGCQMIMQAGHLIFTYLQSLCDST